MNLPPFFWKMIYLALMVPLLILLYVLGRPAAPGPAGARGTTGGLLARLRQEHGLSQAQLGQLDPASETFKLATFGLRGVAAMILWEKADDYKMKKDWTNLAATLNELILVEPHFISVWDFQGHNLSYNVSAEFDDYRERYRWVIRGIEFLKKGTRYNQREPFLQWDIGWYISQKIGRSDEHEQFRVLFKADDDFHGSRPLALRDNWLVGKEWFRKAEEMVDAGMRIRKGTLIFRSDAPMCQIHYADTLEKEGTFGEVAKRQWQQATLEWHQYGSFDIPTSEGVVIHLNDQDMYEENARKLAAQLDALAPGVRQAILEEKRSELSAEQRSALDKPEAERDPKEQELALTAENRTRFAHEDVAARVYGPQRSQARKLAKQATEQEEMARIIERNGEIVNFKYWRLRCQMEQTDEAIAAREWIFKGDQAFQEGALPPAVAAYGQGLAAWRRVLDRFPPLLRNDSTIEDLMQVINRYQRILGQINQRLPKDFILQDVVKLYEKRRGGEAKTEGAKPKAEGAKPKAEGGK